jgi:TPR repeat protein
LKAIKQYARAADLGVSKAHVTWVGRLYREGGYLKKAKFHLEAAAMAGHEIARSKLGFIEADDGNTERAIKHWTIAASAGMGNTLPCIN